MILNFDEEQAKYNLLQNQRCVAWCLTQISHVNQSPLELLMVKPGHQAAQINSRREPVKIQGTLVGLALSIAGALGACSYWILQNLKKKNDPRWGIAKYIYQEDICKWWGHIVYMNIFVDVFPSSVPGVRCGSQSGCGARCDQSSGKLQPVATIENNHQSVHRAVLICLPRYMLRTNTQIQIWRCSVYLVCFAVYIWHISLKILCTLFAL